MVLVVAWFEVRTHYQFGLWGWFTIELRLTFKQTVKVFASNLDRLFSIILKIPSVFRYLAHGNGNSEIRNDYPCQRDTTQGVIY